MILYMLLLRGPDGVCGVRAGVWANPCRCEYAGVSEAPATWPRCLAKVLGHWGGVGRYVSAGMRKIPAITIFEPDFDQFVMLGGLGRRCNETFGQCALPAEQSELLGGSGRKCIGAFDQCALLAEQSMMLGGYGRKCNGAFDQCALPGLTELLGGNGRRFSGAFGQCALLGWMR